MLELIIYCVSQNYFSAYTLKTLANDWRTYPQKVGRHFRQRALFKQASKKLH